MHAEEGETFFMSINDYIQDTLDRAPVLTDEKRDRLTTLFGGDAQ